jgi:hypothetical protein
MLQRAVASHDADVASMNAIELFVVASTLGSTDSDLATVWQQIRQIE